MLKAILLAMFALVCVASSSAEARSHHRQRHHHHGHQRAEQVLPDGLLDLFATSVDRIVRPNRYVAGPLNCAINVGLALAERGIKGTGSALALSYLHWGRASGPVPGAVAVSARRGGGHVAIVSRINRGRVYVWNPSPHGRGWQEIAYRHQALSFRVPG